MGSAAGAGWEASRADAGFLGAHQCVDDRPLARPEAGETGVQGAVECEAGALMKQHIPIRTWADWFNKGLDHKLIFPRSRASISNEGVNVEEKFWTHVRKLFGYHRYGTPPSSHYCARSENLIG